MLIAEGSADSASSVHPYFEGSFELLREVAGITDLRTALPRVSTIVNRMLPHDAVRLACFDPAGQPLVDVATGDVPDVTTRVRGTSDDEVLIGDLRTQGLPVNVSADAIARAISNGYRSVLGNSTHIRGQVLQLAFWSKQPLAFQQDDLPLARWIAYHLAIGAGTDQLPLTIRQRSDAGVGTPRLDRPAHRPGDAALLPGHRRVVGDSTEWRDVLRKAGRVASTDATVLISGESGTGKEVIARLIHGSSPRKAGPFIALNCAALPEQLLESELFGHERGAFTGAQLAKPGQIELASGGALFLDEVSEMSLQAQAKFLRVLQEREFQRLGGTRTQKANIRVIAATNKDLRHAVTQGQFREDLFYRLQVFDITIPPLRDRRTDILPLADEFLDEIGRCFRRAPLRLATAVRDLLVAYDWPGNVRELRNALERAAILADGDTIEPEHLALADSRRPPDARNSNDLSRVERQTILHVLREVRWNKSKAAKRLGLSRTQLYGRMRRYALHAVETDERTARDETSV